jgi:glutamine synthetase
MSTKGSKEITVESLPTLLEYDTKIKLAGVDVDGQLRGKLISKKKFLSIATDGFGFCSVVFGWDMHDQTYFKELKISNKGNGYHDIIAIPDLSTFRRIPWENDVPFFLVSFYDPDTKKPLSACPRGLLKTILEKVEDEGLGVMAGGDQYSMQYLNAWLMYLPSGI